MFYYTSLFFSLVIKNTSHVILLKQCKILKHTIMHKTLAFISLWAGARRSRAWTALGRERLTITSLTRACFYSKNYFNASWGWFHKSWAHGVNHRDSSIHFSPMRTPNFYATKSFSKVGRCTLRYAPNFIKSTWGLNPTKHTTANAAENKYSEQLVTLLEHVNLLANYLQSDINF